MILPFGRSVWQRNHSHPIVGVAHSPNAIENINNLLTHFILIHWRLSHLLTVVIKTSAATHSPPPPESRHQIAGSLMAITER